MIGNFYNSSFYKRNVFGLLTALLIVFTAYRFFSVIFSLAYHASEPWTRICGFFLISLSVLSGPGLFFWSKLKPKTANPFIFPLFVMSTSLGTAMSVLWLLYLCGIYCKISSIIFLCLAAIAGLFGLYKIIKEKLPISSDFHITVSEFAALAVSLLFCEGIFECLAGTAMSSWDAVVSWDKWAADIAARTGLHGYICGAYPQGIPLVNALFYKVLMPADGNPVISSEHLLCNGFFQFFPFLLCISLIAAAREFKINSLVVLGITLGCSGLVKAIIKQSGYVDIPLAAAVASIPSLYSLMKNQVEKSKWGVPVLIAILFPVVFIKGNGFVSCVLALPIFFFLRDKKQNKFFYALLAAILLSGIFYLHQWIAGSWTDLGETSPFNHSLVVMSSHRDLINVSFSHFNKTISEWAGFYGFTSVFMKITWACLLTVSVILPLSVKKTRLPGLLVAALLVIWFFTGSYDARNIFFIIPLFSILIPISLKDVFKSKPAVVKAVVSIAGLAVIFSIWHTRTFEIASRTFSAYKIPKEISMSPFDRAKKYLKADDDEVRFFTDSDAAKRATHIVSASTAYRHLGKKGVYPLQKTGLNDIHDHDMAFSMGTEAKSVFSPGKPFIPVSTMRKGFLPGKVLYLANPQLKPVDFSVVQDGDETILRIRDKGITADSGFISVTTDTPLPLNARLIPRLTYSKATSSFLPYCSQNNIRIMFWASKTEKRLDYSIVNFGEAKITKVEIGY